MNFKPLLRNWKIWVLIAALLFAVISLHPNPWADGVAIRSVVKDSSAALAGISNPSPSTPPMGREVITAINNVPINNMDDYDKFVSGLFPNSSITINTNKDLYRVNVLSKYEIIVLNETELQNYTEEFYNVTTNETINLTKTRLVNKTL